MCAQLLIYTDHKASIKEGILDMCFFRPDNVALIGICLCARNANVVAVYHLTGAANASLLDS